MIGGRDQAAEIAATGTTVDVGDATTRCLLYGLLPSWFVPGLADWAMHRRTRIEDTAGTKESLILPHCPEGRGAALWDVRTAVDSDREVRPVEQHIHGFLESLPFGAPASLMCLHADQVRSLLRGGRGDPDAWRLVPRRRPLSRGCLAGIGLAIDTCVLLPYGEELLRYARTARRNRKRTRDEAK